MKRLPLIPTIFVAAAVAVMIGLGVWQLQRAQWKEALIADLQSTDQNRQTSLACAIDAKPEVRAGRSAEGESGYRYLVPCRGAAREVQIDIGWSKRPDVFSRVRESRTFTGVHAAGEPASRQILVLDPPLPPLERSALPSAEELPNNHLLYSFQWFFFAAAAALIYFLALRRRRSA